MGWFSDLVKGALFVAAVATGVGWFTGAIAKGAAFLGMAAGSAGAFFARQVVVGLVLGALSRATAKNPTGLLNQGITVTARDAIAPHRVIYGRMRVGGTVVYMEGTNNNEYLHMVIAIAGHEIDAIEKVYFNEEEVTFDAGGNVTSANYQDVARVQYKLGTDDQTAFTDLVTESDNKWTNNHRLRGIACLYIRLKFDQDKYPNGIPNVTALVRGKKVYNPATTLTAWSANPALCIADYLTDDKHGLGSSINEIDTTLLASAVNVCNQSVSLAEGGTESRYTLNGAFETSAAPETIITQMLTAMSGSCVWSGGKWRIYAGAYRSPDVTFTEDDLRSGMKIQTLVSRRELFNGVKGTFNAAVNNYIEADFPPVISDTYKEQDNNEQILQNIQLPFTTSASMAQRLAKIELLRARQQITLVLPLKLIGLKAKVGDVIQVTNTRLGWSSKPFEVIGFNISFADDVIGVDLELRETASSVFDWTTDEELPFDPAPNTNLPNAFQVGQVTDLTLTGTNVLAPDGTTQNGILVTWTPPTDSFITQYEVQYIRGSSGQDWGFISSAATSTINWGLITSSATSSEDWGSVAEAPSTGEPQYNSIFVTQPYYVIAPAIAGAEYAVRVRAINAIGVRSGFVTSNQTTYGDDEAPAIPSAIVATGGYKEITLTWVNPTVSDFDLVEIYRNNTNNSSTASLIGVLRGSLFVDSPLGINQKYYYWLKSVDRTGNKSAFSSVVDATTLFIDSDSFSQEVMNLFSEAGAYGIEPVSTLPSTGDFDGQIKYNTTENKLYRWDATNGVWTDDIFSIEAGTVDAASFAAGIEPVSIVNTLPNPSGYTGPKVVFLTTDNKLYRYTGSAWTSAIAAGDLSGTLGSNNFSNSLRPVEVVSSLPSTGNFDGRVAVLTTDGKLYRYSGTGWTAAVNTTDLSGTISNAQIASLAASKVTGQLTDAQIQEISTAKLTGQISGAQISDAAISATKIAASAVTTAKIAVDAITSDVIAAGAITAPKIGDLAVTSGKIADSAVSSAKIAVNAVTESVIAAGAISSDKIQTNAITEVKIASNAITTPKLAAGAVTADTIAANAVTTAKIDAGAITTGKIAAGAVTAGEIAAGSIVTSKIAAGAVTANEIGANAVTAAKIQAGSIETSKIAAGAITSATIAVGAITAGKIAADAVTATEIAAGSITTTKIAADAITSEKIAAGAVTASEIAANAVTAGAISAGSVTTAKIAAGAVTADTIATNAITAVKIQAGAVETAKIAAGAIDAGKIAAGAVITEKLAANAITSDKIDANAITAAKVAAGAITATAIATDAITSDKIQANAITAGKIAAAAVSADQIAANAITSTKIQAGAIVAEKIATGAIQTDKIAANSITAGLLAASGVITNSAQINDGLITNAKIANLAVDNAKIASAAITSAKIADAEVGTLKIAGNAVTIPLYTQLDSSVAFGPYSTGDVLSLTINTGGNPVLCIYSFYLTGTSGATTGNNSYGIDILIDNVAVKQSYYSSVSSTGFTAFVQGVAYAASPPTGDFIVKIRLSSHVINNTITFFPVSQQFVGTYMYVLGTKR